MQQQNLQPVALQERIQTIDIIRGFALFGILTINFTVDHGKTEPWAGFTGFVDQLVYWPVAFFMDDKFLTIYAFLFGLGFSIQMLRAEERNSPFVLVYMRRLIVLYIIGVIHQILTSGDILRSYAMMGVLLLILYKLPRKFLPILAILCFLVPWTRQIVLNQNTGTGISNKIIRLDTTTLEKYTGIYQRENGGIIIVTREGDKLYGEGPGGKPRLIPTAETEFNVQGVNTRFSFIKDSTEKFNSLVLLQNGNKISAKRIEITKKEAQEKIAQRRTANRPQESKSYRAFVLKNANQVWQEYKNWSWSRFFWSFDIKGVLPLFLLGLYFGRRKIFHDISLNRPFLQKVMKWGLLIGMTSFAISLGFDAWNYFNGIKMESYSLLTKHIMYAAGDFLGVMGMALGYVAGMALLLENNNWKTRLSFLAPIGRMGLTNYLLQAAIISIIIDAYGFGLNGKAGPFWRLMMALVTFVFITFISHWWFKHFRIGPAEWLWRSLTYLKFQPMRLKEADKSEIKERENI